MRYVVGYTPTERGADAVALASAVAQAQGAQLDLVYVVKKGVPHTARCAGPRRRPCRRRRAGGAGRTA